MSTTVPPTADFDRPSDFGEFWRHAEAAPRVASLMPEPEVPVRQALTPEQFARRQRMRLVVGGVIASLLAFTALAAGSHLVKREGAASSEAVLSAKPVAAATHREHQAPIAAPTPIAASVTLPLSSELDQALALAREPVATAAKFEDWSQLVARLSAADQRRLEQQLVRASNDKGNGRALRETARLELALLWRATARRPKATKSLTTLARSAKDPVVKQYAKASLNAA